MGSPSYSPKDCTARYTHRSDHGATTTKNRGAPRLGVSPRFTGEKRVNLPDSLVRNRSTSRFTRITNAQTHIHTQQTHTHIHTVIRTLICRVHLCSFLYSFVYPTRQISAVLCTPSVLLYCSLYPIQTVAFINTHTHTHSSCLCIHMHKQAKSINVCVHFLFLQSLSFCFQMGWIYAEKIYINLWKCFRSHSFLHSNGIAAGTQCGKAFNKLQFLSGCICVLFFQSLRLKQYRERCSFS